jgi:N-acetylneuraminate synthase
MKNVIVVAEIGCNHMGQMSIALDMIENLSVYCKVDAVKFQKRTNRESLSHAEYSSPHPNPANSYGPSYGEHREFLEFDAEQHKKLKNHAESKGLIYSCSVWDLTASKEISALQPPFIKIPSACNLNFEIYDYICLNFKGEIHVSLGMTTREEEKRIVDYFIKKGRNKDLVLYACTSGYPVPFEDICLLEIKRLQENYADAVKAIGFSGHHLGIAADVAALTLGASYFERHFTFDRTWKGTDHAASLEPDGMRKLKRDLSNVSKSLKYKEKDILDIENVQRIKLKRINS